MNAFYLLKRKLSTSDLCILLLKLKPEDIFVMYMGITTKFFHSCIFNSSFCLRYSVACP